MGSLPLRWVMRPGQFDGSGDGAGFGGIEQRVGAPVSLELQLGVEHDRGLPCGFRRVIWLGGMETQRR
ncbi:hypothetical protein M0R45_030905 [Rubus argutus]|uniref:Uncharacterized protein n=1 Tax=Rubus argutus TaxID=59490 RepID=A0AAW1WCQ7_RUBAR